MGRNGSRPITRLAALLTVSALIACGGNGDADASQEAGDAEREGARAPGGPSAPGADLEDAQIAALVALINGTEMAAAKAVQPKLAMPEVRAYAGTLIADHARLTEAMPSFDGPRRPPPQSVTLNAVFHSQAAMLGTLPAGYAFDATFVAAQVVDHVMAIDSLWRWREVARTPELRQALGNAIPVMESHLAQARALYTRLDQRVDLGRPGPADTVPPTTAPGPPLVPGDTVPEGRVPGPDTVPPDTAARTRPL